MASRPSEAAGDGWGHDDAPTAHRDPATGPPPDRQRRLQARVAELEAELDRSEQRLQQVVDEYERLLEERESARSKGPLARLRRWLRGL
jgi:chromosome segregation ATPase